MSDLGWLTRRPIAHRGYHDGNHARWENTLSAFEAATAKNFAIECDVHLSADGVPVVIHDEDLRRLTGRDGLVSETSAAELGQMRIGKTPDHPPTLAEMLDLVDGRVPIIVELKGVAGRDAGLVATVGAALSAYHGDTAIMSFDHWLIRAFAAEAPGIPAGLTACGANPQDLESHFAMLAHGISFVSFGVFDLPNRFATTVREKLGMPVITWTVRNPEDVAKTFALADQMTFEGFDPDEAASV